MKKCPHSCASTYYMNTVMGISLDRVSLEITEQISQDSSRSLYNKVSPRLITPSALFCILDIDVSPYIYFTSSLPPFRSIDRQVTLPQNAAFVLADSGVRSDKQASADIHYNKRWVVLPSLS